MHAFSKPEKAQRLDTVIPIAFCFEIVGVGGRQIAENQLLAEIGVSSQVLFWPMPAFWPKLQCKRSAFSKSLR